MRENMVVFFFVKKKKGLIDIVLLFHRLNNLWYIHVLQKQISFDKSDYVQKIQSLAKLQAKTCEYPHFKNNYI